MALAIHISSSSVGLLADLASGCSYTQALANSPEATYPDLFAAAAEALEALRRGEPNAMFEALRQWRREQAEQEEVPAFVVFHDSTLHDIVRRQPQTRAELRACRGVGPAKLQRYGDQVLRLVTDHLQADAARSSIQPLCEPVLEMVASGHPISHIKAAYPELTQAGFAECVGGALEALGVAPPVRKDAPVRRAEVWVASGEHIFHGTRTCRALLWRQGKAKAVGNLDEPPRRVTRAQAESMARNQCATCL